MFVEADKCLVKEIGSFFKCILKPEPGEQAESYCTCNLSSLKSNHSELRVAELSSEYVLDDFR